MNVLRALVKWVYITFLRLCIAPLLYREQRRRAETANERPVEFAFVFKWLAELYPEEILDVGTGSTALPHLMYNCGFNVTASDEMHGYWQGAFFNRHYYVVRDDVTRSRIKGNFDLITCISVLEHIPDHESAVKGMFDLLKPGGHLILTFPYNEQKYADNAYALPGSSYGQTSSYVCQVFSRKEVDSWVHKHDAQIVEQLYYEFFTGDFWTCGEKLCPPRESDVNDRHHITCLILQKLH